MRLVAFIICCVGVGACASTSPQAESTEGNALPAVKDVSHDVPKELQDAFIKLIADGMIENSDLTRNDFTECQTMFMSVGGNQDVERVGEDDLRLTRRGISTAFMKAMFNKKAAPKSVDDINSPSKPTFGPSVRRQDCVDALSAGMKAKMAEVDKLNMQFLGSSNDNY